jgi:hypothetical protein
MHKPAITGPWRPGDVDRPLVACHHLDYFGSQAGQSALAALAG